MKIWKMKFLGIKVRQMEVWTVTEEEDGQREEVVVLVEDLSL